MRRTIGAAVAGLSLVLLAACGGGGDDAETTSGGLKEVTVGAVPILDVAPMHLGIKEGFFEDEGLKLKVQPGQGGAAIVPAVLSGKTTIGFSNMTSLLIGQSKGLPLRVIAPASSSTGEVKKDFAAVVVPGDSDVKTAKDLGGKTVAINTLKNISDTVIRETVRKAGGDAESVKFVEMAFPDMPAAIKSKRVDAAFTVEPFLTITTDAGARPVAWPYAEAVDDLEVAVFFTSKQTLGKDKDTVEKFTRAMVKSQKFATDNPDKLRAIPTAYTEIDPKLLEKLTFPAFNEDVNQESAQALADLAVTDKLVTKKPDVGELFGK